jgi:hypothetical protein
VLQSAPFSPVNIHPQRSCGFGLSPEFSTPVEKTVEIRGFRQGRNVKTR